MEDANRIKVALAERSALTSGLQNIWVSIKLPCRNGAPKNYAPKPQLSGLS